ncbi:pyruvate kinase [Candidatus Desantisbacteria bacterium CG_4_10_14_0_8_um_filter_48_22]|uniref:Pyruvate kinase n=1 Tax=Candidatus Desantisbacteria bacterium CG_4_10_14_0_8_um_filter_48_22 TaxID=1974543 RepID=A0A2M7SE78_9BACT|nr:MAG: pyruvate kinase [Candidatus Desantisbacteria bacterium CG1_02_49_89]PIV56910.1 MAG: pyruvate kinase [Candidatus Desantisbacteria bacterium CG02_land_8_20_14_3_00_49_13]PIZ17835.1 MAG: pyruvate kinase [Candidatus Desantisbacteria bacterium CG_4_10_14_0_8_um_filter_48_22]PJB27389.1 MAG: pyruvate kinase [Candidatus Desantisbacteria bacterium CG_4_9_14_3_um_filter_50_7]
MPKTKIIATLGPASSTAKVIRKMMLAGMDAVRLNFSHGSLREHRERLDIVRELNRKYRRRVRIMQDLQGNRIRIGLLKGHRAVELRKRQVVWLTRENTTGELPLIPFDYRGSISGIKAGHCIYIDDGRLCLVVKGRTGKMIRAQVVAGGLLNEHKGVNIPEAKLEFPRIPDKDLVDIRFGIENKVDYIALSFVRSREDVLMAKKLISGRPAGCRVIAKIECREAIGNIDGIIKVSDGIMIARGDMGISVPVYKIPMIQKEIIKKCNRAGKFVITATQMLESMTEDRIPTRAEVTDVANAILDGTDLVMLSAETAVGRHPDLAVGMMNQIIKYTEQSVLKKNRDN